MFATLLGALPRPDGVDDLNAAIEAVIRAQEAAGLEPVTDGRLGDPGLEQVGSAVERWRYAAGLTQRAVKQTLPGPYTLGRRSAGGGAVPHGTADDAAARAARTLAYAEDLKREVEALATAGCPMVEIEEMAAHLIGADETERALFRDAHARLVDGLTGTHLALSIAGGAAASAGFETILAAPYASLAVDLITGPDDWNLVTRTPGDRGIVVGALGNDEATDEATELLLWGANYAASTDGRGLARVGLGSAGSYANLTWAAAVRKLTALGKAARLADLPPTELAGHVDPRSINAKSAALGRAVPGGANRRRPASGRPAPGRPRR